MNSLLHQFYKKQPIIMKKIYLALMLSLGALVGFGQTTGDISFVGFNVDGRDDFAIVTLADIPANTIIYFSDNESDGAGGLTTGEGTNQWNTGTAIISAGTIVAFTDVRDASIVSIGTFSNISGEMNFSTSGDALFAYTRVDENSPIVFIAGIQSAASKEGDLSGTGLVAGSTFVEFFTSGSPDGGYYSGSRNTASTYAEYLPLIADPANWTTETSNGEDVLPFNETVFSLAGAQIVGFDEATSTVAETNASFEISIPVSLLNYSGSQVDLTVAVTGGSAATADYSLKTSSLSFSANGSMNILLDINDDADDATETIEITLTESTSTGISISPTVHTITITDDDTAPLMITEINYNAISTLGSDNDYEYIEIYNAGSTTINLEGYTLSSAMEGSFTTGNQIAEGEYILVAIVAATYPSTGGQVFEWTSGNLNNSGESIVLKNASGSVVDEVTYNPSINEAANGDGPSLSLFDLTADNGDMTYWIGSGTENGTPGAANADITVWTASTSTDWASDGNWSNGIPTTGVSAVVLSGGSNPIIGADTQVASLKIGTGTSINTTSGTATINNEFILDGSAQVASGASLAILGGSSGSGSLTVLRNTTGSAGYSILGAPVGGVTLSSISADYLYSYNESSSTYTVPTGTMDAGVGFFVGYDAASPTVSFSGSPVSVAVSTPVSLDGDGFNLVANPYAAAISMSAFQTANSANTDGSIYLWDDGGTNEGNVRGGDYVTVNNVGAVSTVANIAGTGQTGSSPANNGFITSAQGFFVKATTAGTAEFSIDMQVTTAGANEDANHYRKEENQLIRLSISGNELYNELLIGFIDNATLGNDHGLDAVKFSGNEFISFYSMQENSKYAIQALPRLNTEITSVQLGMDLAETGEYKLHLNELVGIAEGINISILDNETGIIHNLSETNEVSFSIAGSLYTSKRFQLLLSPAEILSLENQSTFTVFGAQGKINILSEAHIDNANISIYTISGSQLANFRNVTLNTENWSVDFKKQGLFIMTIESEGHYMSRKFLLK
ncbi:MAG: hypothetical protein ACJA0X_001623 [Cyclobacteriaceae bacterium]